MSMSLTPRVFMRGTLAECREWCQLRRAEISCVCLQGLQGLSRGFLERVQCLTKAHSMRRPLFNLTQSVINQCLHFIDDLSPWTDKEAQLFFLTYTDTVYFTIHIWLLLDYKCFTFFLSSFVTNFTTEQN